jgi:peptidoglycan hydrolase-like protein with peptidoglycan-binding domain
MHKNNNQMFYLENINKNVLLLIGLLVTILLFWNPAQVFGAYDDVTLTTDTVISVGGVDIDVSGSSAVMASITVNANNFSVVMNDGSTITVSSSDLYDIAVSPGHLVTSETCSSSEFKTTVTSTATQTVTFTATTDLCSGSVSGGGGGGSGSLKPKTKLIPESSPQEVPTEETVTKPAPVSTFLPLTRTLQQGDQNFEVLRLQQFLNSDPETKIAMSGVGSIGQETDYYGSLTVVAVQKFQTKHGIVSSGTSNTTGYGRIGPRTLIKINEVFGNQTDTTIDGGTTPASPSVQLSTQIPSGSFGRALENGDSGDDVKRLQQLLNSDPDTAVASVGIGSVGNETDYFGSLTEQAVQKFQMKHSVVSSPSDLGYGYVGPKTRAKLQEVFGS